MTTTTTDMAPQAVDATDRDNFPVELHFTGRLLARDQLRELYLVEDGRVLCVHHEAGWQEFATADEFTEWAVGATGRTIRGRQEEQVYSEALRELGVKRIVEL
jgi:hypothetical protein